MAADRLDARGVGQAPSTARYNDQIDARRKAQAADAKAARQADLLKETRSVGVTASAQQRYAEYDAKRAAKLAKEPRITHVPTSKSELMSDSARKLSSAMNEGPTEGGMRIKNYAIFSAEKAIAFGSPQAIAFLIANASYGRSDGYKTPVPKSAAAVEAAPALEITWANVQAQFSKLQNGNIRVTDLQTSHDKNDRVAAWVYSMQHKFTDTHKLTAKEEAICKQFYLDAVNNGNFNMDYFAPGGSCCVLM